MIRKMPLADQKTLRGRATDREALAERARKLFTIPTELSVADYNKMSAFCQALYPLPLVNGKRVLKKAISALSVAERYGILDCLNLANGIKLVFVTIPNPAGDEARLEVQFFNRNYLQRIVDKYTSELATDPHVASRIFSTSGGHRLPAGPATGQVQVQKIEKSADFDSLTSTQPTTLVLTVTPIGDYSTYKLSINSNELPAKGPVVFPPTNSVIIDPVFNEIDFKFRPGCFNINCAPEWEAAAQPQNEPVIDYLAKDYDSFRHTMIAAMMQRVPEWETSSEADLDQVLLDLFSAAADELSDYQDRVMNEAYLSSARKRVSLARHARLMDYHIHQGNQASTWLALEVALAKASAPQPGETREYFLTDPFKVWSGLPKEGSSSTVFLTAGKMRVHQLLDRMSLHTWSNAIPSLAAGDTTADLRLFKPDLTGIDLTKANWAELVAWQPVIDKDSALAVQNLIRSGAVKYLLIQEHLNPVTGTVNGYNPQNRQLLELLPGDDGAEAIYDPTTGPANYDPVLNVPKDAAEWFVRVAWKEKDKLKSNYCFTVDCSDLGRGRVDNVSLFHANLVEVNHGSRRFAFFKSPNANLNNSTEFHYQPLGKWDPRDEKMGKWGTLCALPDHPLAYRNTEPGGDVPPSSTLSVVVSQAGGGTDPWDEVPSLIHSDDSDENGDHFVVETDEEGLSYIRFGNGKNGKMLPDNAVVGCAYQVGNGPDGNIGLDKLFNFSPAANAFLKLETKVLGPTTDGTIIRCWNPFDISNGRAPEPAAEIIRRAPEAYRVRQLRAVTLQDYIKRAEEVSEVSSAAARYAWTGSWRTVQITIDPVGTTVLEAGVREKITQYLNAVRLIGEDLEIRPPRFVPLEIHVSLCAHVDFWPEDLKAILEQEFSDGWTADGRRGFFHPDLWTFGQPLTASQIIGRALAVEGVEHIIEVRMKRWNSSGTFANEITNVNFDEILQVLNDPDHMEKGFIDFVVQGGRR
jgi:hypothetical protein